MPFYEYECRSCKYYLEVMQKSTDAPLTKCPSCGKKALTKLISAPVFRLKGSGWYETDFKTDKERQRNLAGAEGAESKPSESAKDSEGTKSAEPASGPAKGAGSAPKAAESKPESKTPAVVRTPSVRRASTPAARKSGGSGARAAARPRGKATQAKGAAKRRPKR